MAGRPRKMARTVGELEEKAILLAAEVFEHAPEQYRKAPTPSDPIARAWKASIDLTMRASIILEALGDMLREKARITDPGPSREFLNAPNPTIEDNIPIEKEPKPAGETAER